MDTTLETRVATSKTAQVLPDWCRVCDTILIVFTLLFALTLASFTARNSDLWLHIGTGQALIYGDYTFGAHPFTYTGEDVYWVNHSWLFDALIFVIYSIFGGGVLVAAKAILIALVSLLMVQLGQGKSREERNTWFSAVFALLGILTMAWWLPLHPVILSYLFLALTVWLLEKGAKKLRETDTTATLNPAQPLWRTALRAYWPLLLLFAAWVNLDGWFLLGLLAIALYWAGTALGHSRAARRARSSSQTEAKQSEPAAMTSILGLVAAGVAVVCLLNPHHFYVFQFPNVPGFSQAASLLQEDPLWRNWGYSPLRWSYLWLAAGPNPAGVAYLLLLLLGIASFVLNRPRWPLRRGLLWFAFAVLSLYQAHMIPFFAVLAAPVTALNFQETLRSRRALNANNSAMVRRWRIAARPGTCLAATALLIAAWPGWLQQEPNQPTQPRRWEVFVDPSLRAAAVKLGQWRIRKIHPDEVHGFNSSLDVANYCAYFFPNEKSFLNASLHGGRKVVSEYVLLRHALIVKHLGLSHYSVHHVAMPQEVDWLDLAGRYKIHYLTLHADRRKIADGAFFRLTQKPRQWPLVYLKGSVAVFARSDSVKGQEQQPLAKRRVEFDRLAFHPSKAQLAPLQKPSGAFAAPQWWQAFTTPRHRYSLKAQEAMLYLLAFDAAAEKNLKDLVRKWQPAHCAGFVADAAMPLAFHTSANLWLRRMGMTAPPQSLHFNSFKLAKDDGPIATLLLAVRAARRAVKQNPTDTLAYATLGKAYLLLSQQTKERVWRQHFPWYADFRLCQAVGGYKHAIRLKPELYDVHSTLADFYGMQNLNYPDMALEHSQLGLKYARQIAVGPDTSPKAFDESVAGLKNFIKQFAKRLEESEKRFNAMSSRLSILERAKAAGRHGLAKKALAILEEGRVEDLGTAGLALKLDLLLDTGHTKKLESIANDAGLQKKLEKYLSTDRYHLFQAKLAAVTGDYQKADKHLAKISAKSAAHTLRGVLALEVGLVEQAEIHFRQALASKGNGEIVDPVTKLTNNLRPLAEGYLKLIETHRKEKS